MNDFRDAFRLTLFARCPLVTYDFRNARSISYEMLSPRNYSVDLWVEVRLRELIKTTFKN